jgi:hypothetical protein
MRHVALDQTGERVLLPNVVRIFHVGAVEEEYILCDRCAAMRGGLQAT